MRSDRSGVEDLLRQAVAEARSGAVLQFRQQFVKEIVVSLYDDRGVAKPGEEKGQGFAIYIGEWRVGWWASRREACEVAAMFSDAIRQHPLSIPEAF